MKRAIILGRGGAGKSTFARTLGDMTGLPVVELDKHFWQSGLEPMPAGEWVRLQQELTAPERWSMDGNLGPYDALWVRLRRADTVIVLDFPMPRCAGERSSEVRRTPTSGCGCSPGGGPAGPT